MPEWYKADKYKSVAEQAKAYAELEKRFGAFKGAPKDGKYEPPPPPEGVEGTFATDHPVFEKFSTWAAQNQLSQEGYNSVMGLLAEYEAARVPTVVDIKAQIGENADARITEVARWAKANLDTNAYSTLREALTGEQAPAVFKVVETLMGRMRAPAPKATDGGTASIAATPIEQARLMRAELTKDGRRRYDVDASFRQQVEALLLKAVGG